MKPRFGRAAAPPGVLFGLIASIALATPATLLLQATQGAVADGAPAGDDAPQAVATLLTIVLVPTLIYVVRRRLIREINQQMMAVSGAEPDIDDEEDGTNDVDARVRLSLVFHDADEAFATNVHPRLRAEKRLFGHLCLADFGVALGYIVLPLVFGLFAFEEPAIAGLVPGLLLAGFTFMRYLLHRGQFQAYDLSRSRGRQRAYRWLGRILYGILVLLTLGSGATATNVVYLPEILRAVFGHRMRMIVSVLFVAWTSSYAVSLLWSGTTNEAEAFLVISLIVTLLVASLMLLGPWIESLLGHPLSWGWNCVVVTVPALLAAWVAFRIGKLRIDRSFTRNLDQVLAGLRSLEVYPRRLDLSFRHLRALCHKNTWFPAVREFANRADVVLMDLRGYTEWRQGCRKEVNFLFDAVPLDHLLFLVDTAHDKDVVEEMLRGRWARLREASPNLLLPDPVLHLFQVRDNDERDMQAILDRLLTIADAHNGHSAPDRGRAVFA